MSSGVWSCFACERGFSQWVCNIQIRMYFSNFYVYNALHGAILDNCSHFQYVSRLRLRVIWISVKTYIDVTLYGEHFVTSIIEKHVLYLFQGQFWPLSNDPFLDHSCTPWLTHGEVHNRSGTQHGILYRTYDWGIGDDFSFSFYFLPWSGFECLLNFIPCNRGKNSFFDCSILNTFKIMSRYVLIWKYHLAFLIYPHRSWCSMFK